MSSKRRVALAVVLTIVAVSASTAYTLVRLRHWDDIGIAGVTYWPTEKSASGKAPPFRGFKPGSVFMLYPGGSAERAGLKANDLIVSINGIPLEEGEKLHELERRVRSGDVVTFRVLRGNQTVVVPVPFASPLHNTWFGATCVNAAIVALAFISIGLFVFVKQPDDRRVVVFYAMAIVGSLTYIGLPALILDASNIRGLFREPEAPLVPMIVLFGGAMAFLPLMLHLALVFPKSRRILDTSPRVLRWIYGLPAAMLVGLIAAAGTDLIELRSKELAGALKLPLDILAGLITLAGFILAFRMARHGRGAVRRAFWSQPVQSLFVITAIVLALIRLGELADAKWIKVTIGLSVTLVPCLILFLGFPILTCISMYRSYREAGAEERRQVKWPLWGTVFAVATRILIGVTGQGVAMYLLLTGGNFSGWLRVSQVLEQLSLMLFLLIPISFAFAILKYRLMNIDVIIRKTVVYAMLSGAIIVLYLGIVGVLGTLLVTVAGVENQTMIIGATLFVALVFVPMRNKLQTLVERNLFRHKYDYPEALRAVGAEALMATDLGAFLASAAEKIQQAVQNRAVVTFARRHGEFVSAAKVGVADSLLGTLRMARTSLPFLDRPFDPRRHQLAEDAAAALERIEAVLVVPINTPRTPANGFIALAPKLSGADFDVEDIDFLRSMADQIDIGIDRIRMQREDEDYEQARAIQERLIPREMPRVAGIDVAGMWQPARTMGGDYYDLLELSETELAICIGDVAGKGMTAALLMSGLQAAVRASASSSPRDLCERVRRVVVSSLSGGRFVTFFYATVDAAAMRLRWSNAGHNAPILARADGSIVRLTEGGPAISRMMRGAYEEREIALQPGDRLVLFTDGVSEVLSESGEMFGEERIEEIAASAQHATAEELQHEIVASVSEHRAGEVEDDLTLVVLRIV